MLVVFCTNCVKAFRVIGEAAQVSSLVGHHSQFWPDKYPCPHCEQNGYAMLESDVDPKAMTAFSVTDLSAEELFAALNGLGLPSEKDCSAEVVQRLFREKKVKRIDGHTVHGTNRFFVNFFEFDDGTRAYFSASSYGALIYRITEPHSYTKQALHAE